LEITMVRSASADVSPPHPLLAVLEVPRTPFNKTISARRNFAYGSVSLNKVKKVKDE
jgi:wax ester synthase-like acyl-CoA acyltransferase family protein